MLLHDMINATTAAEKCAETPHEAIDIADIVTSMKGVSNTVELAFEIQANVNHIIDVVSVEIDSCCRKQVRKANVCFHSPFPKGDCLYPFRYWFESYKTAINHIKQKGYAVAGKIWLTEGDDESLVLNLGLNIAW